MTTTARRDPRFRSRHAQTPRPHKSDIPYTMKLAGGRTVFVEVPARMARTDRGGEVAFTPEGVRLLDQVRALAAGFGDAPSPALLATVRQAAGMTQEQLGRELGRDKLTVSRWECGTMRPGRESVQRLKRLFHKLKRRGVVLPGPDRP